MVVVEHKIMKSVEESADEALKHSQIHPVGLVADTSRVVNNEVDGIAAIRPLCSPESPKCLVQANV